MFALRDRRADLLEVGVPAIRLSFVDLPFGAEGLRHIVLIFINSLGGLPLTTALLATTCTHVQSWFYILFPKFIEEVDFFLLFKILSTGIDLNDY